MATKTSTERPALDERDPHYRLGGAKQIIRFLAGLDGPPRGREMALKWLAKEGTDEPTEHTKIEMEEAHRAVDRAAAKRKLKLDSSVRLQAAEILFQLLGVFEEVGLWQWEVRPLAKLSDLAIDAARELAKKQARRQGADHG